MSRLGGIMNIGQRSLANSQAAIQTTAHNISNKSTEGYSRQRVELQTTTPQNTGNYQIGTGARISGVTSVKNQHLEKQIEQENAKLGFAKSQSDAMGRVEQVFNEQINKGLNHFVGEFFNAWRELSINPENHANRTLVKETGEFMVKDFQRINGQMKEIQNDLDFQIKGDIKEVNAMAKEIASLNEKVQMGEMAGGNANDMRDRRDSVLKKLGEKINIHWNENKKGQVIVTAGDSALMVSGFEAGELMVGDTPERGAKREGNVDILFKSSTGSVHYITPQIRGGSVGAALKVRDEFINNTLSQVDQIAYTLAEKVNDVHAQGFDRYSKQAGEFFELPTELRDASMHLKISEDVAKDVGKIATAAIAGAPGDNRIANQVASIQNEMVMNEGTNTMDDFYNSMVGEVGVTTKKSNNLQEHQANIVSQLKNIRESISGVSLDEEAVKMVEFQRSFDASAKLIKTADEMLETVINLKR